LSEQDNEASELDKAEEVLGVEFPADEYAALPLYPGKETLDEPASHIGQSNHRNPQWTVARYLAAHSPTESAALQRADIARRLMRGGELHQEEVHPRDDT
jgi:hypothetical protein